MEQHALSENVPPSKKENIAPPLGWDEATNFPRVSKKLCRPARLCRHVSCDTCAAIHRKHFIQEIERQHSRIPYVAMLIPSLATEAGLLHWEHLSALSKAITATLGRKPGANIRVLAIGTAKTPHIHILASTKYLMTFQSALSLDLTEAAQFREIGGLTVNIRIIQIDDLSRLASYLFEMNYRPTALDRPARMRLLLASHGPRLGFPAIKAIQAENVT